MMSKRLKNVCISGIQVVFFIFVFSKLVMGEVIFEDNFDDSPDWQSQQTVNKSVGGQDISFGVSSTILCTSLCPPQGWTSYRAASSQWTDNRRRDSFILNAVGARGGSGKGITYNPESTDRYGLWTGGSLDLWLGKIGYQELYIRMYIKYTEEWAWSSEVRDMHGQQKLVRISVFNDEIASTSYNPQDFSSASVNRPVWYPDWYYNSAYNFSYFFSTVVSSPDGGVTESSHMDVTFPANASNDARADNQWHSYEFRIKMNSAPGVEDGEWEFFLDGISKKSRNDIAWKKIGSNNLGWNWLMFLDNITVSPYAKSENREMAIYMDDVVVSTSYIGLVNDTTAPSPPTNPVVQ